MSDLLPDPLPLRSIEVPRAVTAVAGCGCGGLQWHAEGCSIWAVPHDGALAAVAAAEDRLRDFGDSLNARLRAALGNGP